MRKDLAKRLAMFVRNEADPNKQWAKGEWFTVSLRQPSSGDQVAVGIVVQTMQPITELHYRFAALDALASQYNEETLALWGDLIARTQRCIDAGDFTSPAPGAVVYSRPAPFNYPDSLTALDRLWSATVNLLRHPSRKTRTDGGHIENPELPLWRVVRAMRAQHGALMADTVVKPTDGTTLFTHGGRCVAVTEAGSDATLREHIQAAALSLSLEAHDRPAELLILSERAAELMDELGDLLRAIQGKLNISPRFERPDHVIDELARFLRNDAPANRS